MCRRYHSGHKSNTFEKYAMQISRVLKFVLTERKSCHCRQSPPDCSCEVDSPIFGADHEAQVNQTMRRKEMTDFSQLCHPHKVPNRFGAEKHLFHTLAYFAPQVQQTFSSSICRRQLKPDGSYFSGSAPDVLHLNIGLISFAHRKPNLKALNYIQFMYLIQHSSSLK